MEVYVVQLLELHIIAHVIIIHYASGSHPARNRVANLSVCTVKSFTEGCNLSSKGKACVIHYELMLILMNN